MSLMPMHTLFKGSTNPVDMEVFDPSTRVTPLGKSVVVAYGTDGLMPTSKDLIEDFCRDDLAKAGYTVALPRYLEITKTSPGGGVIAALTAKNLKLWTDAIVEAVKWCATKQGNGNVALIGFSLGGYMAARTALATPVKLFVDFFGPMNRFGLMPFPSGEQFNATKAKGLPPTQIHHGSTDTTVPPSESADLVGWLQTAKIDCDPHVQYACGHPHDLLTTPWTSAAQKAATTEVLKFLKKM
jgi:dienelactone hydrolase